MFKSVTEDMHELLRVTRQYLSEKMKYKTKAAEENETRLLRTTSVPHNSCVFRRKHKSATSPEILRRPPTTGTFYEHSSIVNGALCTNIESLSFPTDCRYMWHKSKEPRTFVY